MARIDLVPRAARAMVPVLRPYNADRLQEPAAARNRRVRNTFLISFEGFLFKRLKTG